MYPFTSRWSPGRSFGISAICWLVAVGVACGEVDDSGLGSTGGSPGGGEDSGVTTGGYSTDGGGHTGGGAIGSGGAGGTGGETADNACFPTEEIPSCSSLEDIFSRSVDPGPGVELARASDFGDDVEFVALGGYAVLFERRDATGPQRFAAFRIDQSGEPSDVLEFAASLALPDLEAKDVVADIRGFPPLAALACESEVCRIWGNPDESNVLVPLELPEVPSEVQAERLTLTIEGSLCVFGAQLACLSADELWVVAPPLPPETGTRFRTVLAGQPTNVARPTFALTDSGVVLVLATDGSDWIRHLEADAEPIREVVRLYDTVIAVGSDGLWIPRLREAPQDTCQTEGIQALLPLDTWSSSYALISDDGSLFVRRHVAGGESYRWCMSATSIETPVIGLSVQMCGIAVIPLTLSPEQLFAPLYQPRCVID